MAEFDDTGMFAEDSEGDEKDCLLSIATAMSRTLETGTFSRSKLGIGQRFAGVFRGKAAVDWMIDRGYALGREDALQLGTTLIKAGWIMHCRKPGERLKDKSTSLYKFTDELKSAIERKVAQSRRREVLSSSKHVTHSFETPIRTPVALAAPPVSEQRSLEASDPCGVIESKQAVEDVTQPLLDEPATAAFVEPIPQPRDHQHDFDEIRTKLVQLRLSMHSTNASIRRLEGNTLTLSPHEQAVVSALLAGLSLGLHAIGASDPTVARKVSNWLREVKRFPNVRLERALHAVIVCCRVIVLFTAVFLLIRSCVLMVGFGFGKVSVVDLLASACQSAVILFAFGLWYHKSGHHALRHLSGSSPSTTSSYSGYESEDADRSESGVDVPAPVENMIDVTPTRNGLSHAHRRHGRHPGRR